MRKFYYAELLGYNHQRHSLIYRVYGIYSGIKCMAFIVAAIMNLWRLLYFLSLVYKEKSNIDTDGNRT